MKTIERLIRKTATEVGTWEATHYTSLKQARQLNPNEYANSFRLNVETRPSAAIDRAYDGQAHHMSKAAHSLVNMLNGLDYSKLSTADAVHFTSTIHHLITGMERALKTCKCGRTDGIHDGRVTRSLLILWEIPVRPILSAVRTGKW